jgi:hypothetical protein
MKAEASGSNVGAENKPIGAVKVPTERLYVAVGIATAGRPEVLAHTLDLIGRQTRLPDLLVICPAVAEDIGSAPFEHYPFSTIVRIGRRGLTAQRNQVLSNSGNADVIVFFDDDFFPQADYLEQVEKIFLGNVDVVAATGRPLFDGANGPGLSTEEALRLLPAEVRAVPNRASLPTYGTYGCNMAFRADPIRQYGLRFDENLPLYGWQEDIDFSRQLSPFGQIIDSNTLRGVHLGAKGGRTSGVRFGYSQIANPIYLIRKGTMSGAFARSLIWRNMLANLGKCIRPEPWIDRRGRLKGNCLAMIDLVLGRISPQRILQLR